MIDLLLHSHGPDFILSWWIFQPGPYISWQKIALRKGKQLSRPLILRMQPIQLLLRLLSFPLRLIMSASPCGDFDEEFGVSDVETLVEGALILPFLYTIE